MIKHTICLLFLLPSISGCHDQNKDLASPAETRAGIMYSSIGDIPAPPGFHRTAAANGSFGDWLKTVKLKKTTTVYLYNGKPKDWQGAQFAVIDMPVGDKDLQQCADAVMRLRAEYFYSKGLNEQIVFQNGVGVKISFAKWLKGERYKTAGNELVAYQTTDTVSPKRKQLEDYLETVFTYCGTYSLAEELKHAKVLNEVMPGDVFIKPGSPGHAMIVVDVAENDKGEKVFMLAQSYMPAQDIHIVKNPQDDGLSPWYPVNSSPEVVTPQWTFRSNQLKGW